MSTYDIRIELESLLENKFPQKLETEAELEIEENPFSEGTFNYAYKGLHIDND